MARIDPTYAMVGVPWRRTPGRERLDLMKASDTLATLAVLSILVLASACGKKEDPAWSGYIEGDYVYVASPLAGALQTLAVRRGESVAKG